MCEVCNWKKPWLRVMPDPKSIMPWGWRSVVDIENNWMRLGVSRIKLPASRLLKLLK